MSTTVDLPDLNVWLALACPAHSHQQQAAEQVLFCTVTALGLVRLVCQQPDASMASAELTPRLCTDAYLAALAIANGWRLVSFDRDFERFKGLERLALR